LQKIDSFSVLFSSKKTIAKPADFLIRWVIFADIEKQAITTFNKAVKNETAHFLNCTGFFSYFHTAKKTA